jgi:peptide/nickel transport system ATP-binding protein
MAAIPRLDSDQARLQEIPGMVPLLTRPIAGCAFAERCASAADRCRAAPPPAVDVGGNHRVVCWEVTP